MTLTELRSRLAEIQRTTPEEQVMPAFVKLFGDRYEEFDAAARREADRIIDGMIQLGVANAREKIGSMEEGPDKRSLRRLIARGDREHVTAYDLVAVLEGKTSQTAEVVSEAVQPFVSALQVCVDLLFDARLGTRSGRDVVLHGLFIGLVDELLVAFHLAQRAFASQAYAHVRTIEEVLDAVEVLRGDSGLLKRWLDATVPAEERAVFGEIRKRVGKSLATDGSKTLYAFLSALGPHSQFRSVRARGRLEEDGFGQRTATFFFLGSPTQIEAVNVLTVRAAVALAHHVSRAFAIALDDADVDVELDRCRTMLADLVRAHLLPIAEQMSLTAGEVQQVLAHRIGQLP